MRKYQLPAFLDGVITQDRYDCWLQRKSQAHVRRDRKRGNKAATIEEYKIAIHDAVICSRGLDSYTGERLDWKLLSKWNNKEAKDRGRLHKREFHLLPSVDHIGDGRGKPEFKICAMLTNDVKSDLTHQELLQLCEKLLRAAGRWPGGTDMLK